MAKFHAWRKCTVCSIHCTPMNFVDVDGDRICLGCWTERMNPDHPELEAIKSRIAEEVNVWHCKKFTRDENGLPNGPKSIRRD